MALRGDNAYFYWQKGEDFALSACFSTREFSCHCTLPSCQEQKISQELLRRLLKVRVALGSAIQISSGFRCQAYQAELKAKGYETAQGVSQHELGEAADLVSVESPRQLLEECKKEFSSIGISYRFTHVDTRSKNQTWLYHF